MDQRGLSLRRLSADGLVRCGWSGDLDRGRSARDKTAVVAIGRKRLGLRQAQWFVLLANGRIGLSAELNRRGGAGFSVGHFDRFALSQSDHIPGVE